MALADRPILGGPLTPVVTVTPAGGGGSPTPDQAPLFFNPIVTEEMGNAAPVIVVPANASRRALWITNISAVAGYFAFGNGALLATGAACAFRLLPFQTVSLAPPLSQQDIYAVCGAAVSEVSYQEAV